jgi:hypothetical protein
MGIAGQAWLELPNDYNKIDLPVTAFNLFKQLLIMTVTE